MQIEDIKPYPNNAKKHPDKQLKQLYAIVKRVGWRQPALVNQKGVLIAGHGRFMTWEKYKAELKPIWIIDDMGRTVYGEPETTPMTPEEEKAYRLADNKLNESEWDMKFVLDDLKELVAANFNIDLTGFNTDLILDEEDGEDDIPEVPAEPKSKHGEIYQLGDHRLMCGDSTDPVSMSKLMGGGLTRHGFYRSALQCGLWEPWQSALGERSEDQERQDGARRMGGIRRRIHRQYTHALS